MQIKNEEIWKVVVIGGGASGMMAAARACERGNKVLLLEKNPILGKKLLITGGGRCNVANNKPDIRTLAAKYKDSADFLYSSFSQFALTETLEFFSRLGVMTKEENENRLFPTTEKALTIQQALIQHMKNMGVEVSLNASVLDIIYDKGEKLFRIKLNNQEEIKTEKVIISTGGTSRPETGSTGDGFRFLKSLRHTILENSMALVPIALHDEWVKTLGGVTLSDAKLTVYQEGKKQSTHRGKILCTHFGISGPMVLNMSREVGELLEYGEVTLSLDLFPDLDPGSMKERVQGLLTAESNKKLKNALSEIIPTAFVTPLLGLMAIDADTPCHSVRSEERKQIIAFLKAIPLHVKCLLGSDKAVVSSGGVALEEIDFRTMESRLVPGLYVTGDVLNIDRPSGGYSLQLCWTTGFVAGSHI